MHFITAVPILASGIDPETFWTTVMAKFEPYSGETNRTDGYKLVNVENINEARTSLPYACLADRWYEKARDEELVERNWNKKSFDVLRSHFQNADPDDKDTQVSLIADVAFKAQEEWEKQNPCPMTRWKQRWLKILDEQPEGTVILYFDCHR